MPHGDNRNDTAPHPDRRGAHETSRGFDDNVSDDESDDDDERGSRAEHALEDLLYSADSFSAVLIPVALTMIVSSLAVVFINDGTNGKSAGGTGIPVIYETTGSESNEELFTQSVINALAIIGVIIAATFIMVALFYLGYVKLLVGYLLLSTSLLFLFSTGLMVQVGMSLVPVPFDAISYYFIFVNFAVVGVLAIFYQKGIPLLVTQGYLVIMSVTMAWIWIRYLPEWTTWALLAVLAIYDLCAVLTPCGPLRLLVNIMQSRPEQPLPGLLYEARVNTNNAAPSDNGQYGGTRETTTTTTRETFNVATDNAPPPARPTGAKPRLPPTVDRSVVDVEAFGMVGRTSSTSPLPPETSPVGGTSNTSHEEFYRLPSSAPGQSNPTMDGRLRHDESMTNRGGQGEAEQDPDADADDRRFAEYGDKSIKLGLGDFIFYSILCAKSALVSFTSFIAVFVSVIFGLAATLLLLALYRTALPALPISIALGLFFFFLSEVIISPALAGFNESVVFF